jgi:hypothetical protein
MDDQAMKESENKARWDLLPFEAMRSVVQVYEVGAQKYDDHNWRKGIKFSTYIAAIFRHLIKFVLGEDRDGKSGCHHLAAVVFYCLALITFTAHKTQYKRFDDRTAYAEKSENIRECDCNK